MIAQLKQLLLPWWWGVASLAILAGTTLTILSHTGICSVKCSEVHNWRIFGFTFEIVGLAFFATLIVLHLKVRTNTLALLLATAVIASGVGSELVFIGVQKFLIKSWCPVCLTIAACVGVTAIAYTQSHPSGGRMKTYLPLAAFVFGMLFSMLGIAKENQLEAAQQQVEEQLWLGNQSSDMEVYIFTDWACPACRKAEAAIEETVYELLPSSKITFVDVPIHPITYNYSPYNVMAMINNKPNYLLVRAKLTELSLTNKSPTDKDVKDLFRPMGLTFKEIPYSTITLSTRYFKQLREQFNVNVTPTVVIKNRTSGETAKLTGRKEVNKAQILQTYNKLKG